VRILVGSRPKAVLVSERAVFDVPGSKAVNIVTGENKVAVRNITTDGSYQGKSIVIAGLGGGETVIVEPAAKLIPGQVVAPRPAQAGQVYP
jgi:hypothetical protein